MEVHADVSEDGLEACLCQQKQSIAFASRALTQNYPQNEKELLTSLFTMTKPYRYVFSAQVIAQSYRKQFLPSLLERLQYVYKGCFYSSKNMPSRMPTQRAKTCWQPIPSPKMLRCSLYPLHLIPLMRTS